MIDAPARAQTRPFVVSRMGKNVPNPRLRSHRHRDLPRISTRSPSPSHRPHAEIRFADRSSFSSPANPSFLALEVPRLPRLNISTAFVCRAAMMMVGPQPTSPPSPHVSQHPLRAKKSATTRKKSTVDSARHPVQTPNLHRPYPCGSITLRLENFNRQVPPHLSKRSSTPCRALYLSRLTLEQAIANSISLPPRRTPPRTRGDIAPMALHSRRPTTNNSPPSIIPSMQKRSIASALVPENSKPPFFFPAAPEDDQKRRPAKPELRTSQPTLDSQIHVIETNVPTSHHRAAPDWSFDEHNSVRK